MLPVSSIQELLVHDNQHYSNNSYSFLYISEGIAYLGIFSFVYSMDRCLSTANWLGTTNLNGRSKHQAKVMPLLAHWENHEQNLCSAFSFRRTEVCEGEGEDERIDGESCHGRIGAMRTDK
jgi:hypothetical protein